MNRLGARVSPARHWGRLTATSASLVSSGATLAAQVFSIPLLLPVLGEAGFSAFQVCLSLAPWFALTAFGLDKSLKNVLLTAPTDATSALRERAASLAVRRWALVALASYALGPVLEKVVLGHGQHALGSLGFATACSAMAATGALSIGREALFALGMGRRACGLQAGAMAGVLAALGGLWWFGNSWSTAQRMAAALGGWFGPQIVAGLTGAWFSGVVPRTVSSLWKVPKSDHADRGMMIATFAGLFSTSLDFVVLSWFASPRAIVEYTFLTKIVAVHAMFFSGYLSFAWVSWGREFRCSGASFGAARLPRGVREAAMFGAGSALALSVGAWAGLESLGRLLGVEGISFASRTYFVLGLVLLGRTAADILTTVALSRGRPEGYVRATAAQALVTVPVQVTAVAAGLGAPGLLIGSALGWGRLSVDLYRTLTRGGER